MPDKGIKGGKDSICVGSKTSSIQIARRGLGSGGGVSDYWPTNSDFVEVWRHDMESGNLISQIGGNTYTKTGGTGGVYAQAGPAGTNLVSHHYQNHKFQYANVPAAMIPGTGNFSIIFVANTSTNYDWVIFDLGSVQGSAQGIYIGKIATDFYMTVVGASGACQTRWSDANGATALEDGNWHHVRVIGDVSTTKMEVELDGVAQTTTKTAGVDLNAVGSITPTSYTAIGGQGNNLSRLMANNHAVAYVAYVLNTTTNSPLLP